MIPQHVRVSIEECERYSTQFSVLAAGSAFKDALASDFKDIRTGSPSILLVGEEKALATVLPQALRDAIDNEVPRRPGSRFLLLDPDRSELALRFKSLATEADRGVVAKHLSEAPFGVASVRMVVARPHTPVLDPEWVYLLASFADVVVTVEASDTVVAFVAELGDLPTCSVSIDLSSAVPAIPRAAALPRGVRIALPSEEDFPELLKKIATELADSIVDHRCLKLLERTRRELQFESERANAVLAIRDRMSKALQAQKSQHDDNHSAKARRAAKEALETSLIELEAQLAQPVEIPPEHIAHGFQTSEMVWHEDHIDGFKRSRPEIEWWQRLTHRKYLLSPPGAAFQGIEKRMEKVLAIETERDVACINKALGRMESDAEERLARLTDDFIQWPALELPRFSKAGSAAGGQAVLQSKLEEKFERPGVMGLFGSAQSFVSRALTILALMSAAGYSGFAIFTGDAVRSGTNIRSRWGWAILLVIVGILVFLWIRMPRHERRELHDAAAKLQKRLEQSAEDALRDLNQRRSQALRDHFHKVRTVLNKFWDQVEELMRVHQLHNGAEASMQEQMAAAAVVFLQQKQTQRLTILSTVSASITALGRPADAAVKKMSVVASTFTSRPAVKVEPTEPGNQPSGRQPASQQSPDAESNRTGAMRPAPTARVERLVFPGRAFADSTTRQEDDH